MRIKVAICASMRLSTSVFFLKCGYEDIIGSYPLSSFHKSLETKESFILNLLLFLTRLHPPPFQQCTSSRTTKYPPSLSLESFLSFTPIFTSMATKHSFLPHFLGFTYLINLLSCHKLGKMLTNFEFPYMICTCCLIWLEVLAVEYRHIRLLFLLLLY